MFNYNQGNDHSDYDDYDDDDEYMNYLRSQEAEAEVDIAHEEYELTIKQAKSLRNKIEKNLKKAKFIVWKKIKGQLILELKYTETLNFEI